MSRRSKKKCGTITLTTDRDLTITPTAQTEQAKSLYKRNNYKILTSIKQSPQRTLTINND